MRVVGLRLPTVGARRVLLGVVLEVETSAVVGLINHVTSVDHSEATQARELRDALGANLTAYPGLAAGVLWEADYNPNNRVKRGTKARLRLEGAALTACRDHISNVQVLSGQALGKACGGSKLSVLEAAADLPVDKEYLEPAAAALAARAIAQASAA